MRSTSSSLDLRWLLPILFANKVWNNVILYGCCPSQLCKSFFEDMKPLWVLTRLSICSESLGKGLRIWDAQDSQGISTVSTSHPSQQVPASEGLHHEFGCSICQPCAGACHKTGWTAAFTSGTQRVSTCHLEFQRVSTCSIHLMVYKH